MRWAQGAGGAQEGPLIQDQLSASQETLHHPSGSKANSSTELTVFWNQGIQNTTYAVLFILMVNDFLSSALVRGDYWTTYMAQKKLMETPTYLSKLYMV